MRNENKEKKKITLTASEPMRFLTPGATALAVLYVKAFAASVKAKPSPIYLVRRRVSHNTNRKNEYQEEQLTLLYIYITIINNKKINNNKLKTIHLPLNLTKFVNRRSESFSRLRKLQHYFATCK